MRSSIVQRPRAPLPVRFLKSYLLPVVLLLFGLVRSASAAPQVSSDFARVAKALAKRVGSDQLAKICVHEAPSKKLVCRAVTDSVSTAFAMAIDGKIDETTLNAVLVELASKLTQAAAADAAKNLIELLLTEVNRHAGATCQLTSVKGGQVLAASPREVAQEFSACLVARVLRSEPEACAAIHARMASLNAVCKPSDGNGQSDYGALLAFTQLKRLLEGSAPSGFYSAVASAAQSYDSIFAGIDSPNDMSIFYTDELAKVLVAHAGEEACTNVAATRARLLQWQGERYAVFRGLSRALAAFDPLPDALLGKLPIDLPDPGCPAGHPLTAATLQLEGFANTYRTDLTLTAALDPVILPAFLGALLVDYVRDHDDRALREHVQDFALRVLARAIATRDTNGMLCDAKTCSELVPSAPPLAPIALPKDILADEVQAVIEDRFSSRSARRTCEYQAVVSALGRNVELGAENLCRKLGLFQPDDLLGASGAFSAWLEPGPAPEYGKWSTAQVSRVRPGIARLAFAGRLDVNVAYANLSFLLSTLSKALGEGHRLLPFIDMLEEALEPLLDHRSFDFSRVVLAASARKLQPVVEDFLDQELLPITCAQSADASSLRCGVRLLIGTVYGPLVDYVVIENPTDADRRRLATLAYHKALELDPLSRTPLLFNVGLGVTGLTRFGDESLHMTLLDKVGLALRWGERNNGEAGLFVGGFLDSIIRTASDSPQEQQYWLAGGTIGWRQFSSSLPFGCGLHVAAALPFDLEKAGDRLALAGGLVLTVPADIAFGD